MLHRTTSIVFVALFLALALVAGLILLGPILRSLQWAYLVILRRNTDNLAWWTFGDAFVGLICLASIAFGLMVVLAVGKWAWLTLMNG